MSRPNLNVLQFIHCFVFLVLAQLWRHAIMMSHTYDVTQSWRHATMTSHHYDVAQLWRHTIMTSCFGFITQKPSLTCNMSSDKINWKVFLEKITKTFEWKTNLINVSQSDKGCVWRWCQNTCYECRKHEEERNFWAQTCCNNNSNNNNHKHIRISLAVDELLKVERLLNQLKIHRCAMGVR